MRLPNAGTEGLPSVFVDYAHTPDALENVLETLKALAPGRLICLFGCGGDRDRGKRPLMGEVAAQYADVVIVTSDNPEPKMPMAIIDEIIPGLTRSGKPEMAAAELLSGRARSQGYARITSRHEAICKACSLAGATDSILIAGKGHEDYQIIGSTKHFFDDTHEAINGLVNWNSVTSCRNRWQASLRRATELFAQVSTIHAPSGRTTSLLRSEAML